VIIARYLNIVTDYAKHSLLWHSSVHADSEIMHLDQQLHLTTGQCQHGYRHNQHSDAVLNLTTSVLRLIAGSNAMPREPALFNKGPAFTVVSMPANHY
jgi:hypothetical protein